jgi:hypothetical protein
MLEAFIDGPVRHRHLTVFPVVAPHAPVLPYLLSTEIQDRGVLTVRERGDVETPMVLARNNSIHPLLVLAGEPLPGENPGRLVSRSFLLGGKTVTQLPAPSVERGGWTDADREAEITEWVNAFPIRKHQVGLLACIEDRIVGLEAFGGSNLYEPLHRRLLIRFVKQALGSDEAGESEATVLEDDAQKFVDAIELADRADAKRIGVGDYWLLTGPAYGGELIHQGHLVHVSVAPTAVGAAAGLAEGE